MLNIEFIKHHLSKKKQKKVQNRRNKGQNTNLSTFLHPGEESITHVFERDTGIH